MDEKAHGPAVPNQVAEIGEYFALGVATGPGWLRFEDLLAPDVLAALVGATRRAMARFSRSAPEEVPARAAASSLQLAMAARLISPVIGSVAALQRVPLLTADVLCWSADHHSVRFAVSALSWQQHDDAGEAARCVAATLLDSVLAELIDRMHTASGLSPKIMWGNVISAANGAVTVLGSARPALVPAGRRLVGALAGTGPLRDTAVTDGPTFRRRTCCLYYQVPGGGLCGDCVLQTSARSH
ncbi:MAG: (2Fe-2S)-binding protein [Actinomycetota bacterium]|nr:(2Fe-2S)-binding protein [Actinomycetota bacterium]